MIGERIGEENESENPWIPAFGGMTSTAFVPSFPRSLSSRRRGAGIHTALTEHECRGDAHGLQRTDKMDGNDMTR